VYLYTADPGEPVLVATAKARSHGEPPPDIALVVSDVEHGGDPRAGVRVAVHGAELIAQRREETEQRAAAARRSRDAAKVREAIASSPGIGTTDLRARVRLSGDRVRAAVLELGEAIEVRTETVAGHVRARHYIRGGAS
jgi:hypothetical protein